MEKQKDGSVILTKAEFAELKGAYKRVVNLIDSFPSSMEDFFERKHTIAIRRWEMQLQGKKFKMSDWFEEEESE